MSIRHFKIYALLGIIIFLSGCGRQKKSGGEGSIVIEGYDTQETLWSPLPIKTKIICLSDAIPLTGIHSVRFLDDVMVLGTERGVFCYDMEGNFLLELSHQGRSSSEWLTVGPVLVDAQRKNVIIFDPSKCQLIDFSIQGEYLGTTDLPDRFSMVNQAELLPSGQMALSYYISDNSGVFFSLENGGDYKDPVFVCGTPVSTNGMAQKTGSHPLSVHDGSIKLSLSFDNNIYEYRDGALVPFITFSTNRRLLTTSDLEKMNDFSIIELLTQMQKGSFVGPANVFENSTHILLTRFDNSCVLIDKASGDRVFAGVGSEFTRMWPLGLVGVADDYFIGVVDSFSNEIFLNKVPDNCEDQTLLEIKRLMKEAPDPNPIILLYKF